MFSFQELIMGTGLISYQVRGIKKQITVICFEFIHFMLSIGADGEHNHHSRKNKKIS